MRYFLFFLTAMFVIFAALQLNDPDPLLWVPLYLVPAGAALVAAFAWLGYGLTVAYAALAGWWWPAHFDGVTGPMPPTTP